MSEGRLVHRIYRRHFPRPAKPKEPTYNPGTMVRVGEVDPSYDRAEMARQLARLAIHIRRVQSDPRFRREAS